MPITTTQTLIVVSVTTGIAVLGVLARYLRRRKVPRPVRRTRKYGGRRTRNSIRSQNDIASIAGSKASARSHSPSVSLIAHSDRLSLASGSLGAHALNAVPLTVQQLGTMGLESLDAVINYFEEALQLQQSSNDTLTNDEEAEFCRQLQNILDMTYALQEQCDTLFLDQRSVLFREENHNDTTMMKSISKADRSNSDPNFDSAESFASALDQVADLREFEEFNESFPEFERYPLYQNAIKHFEENSIPYRSMRTELVNCSSDCEYLAKLHCIRLAFQYLFKDPTAGRWVADTGRQILADLLLLSDKDPKDFLVGYEDMMNFVQDPSNWQAIEKELELRNVKAMTFYDVVLDFIILDAFRDLDSPPASVTAVVQNRFLSNGFKETALTTAVWSVLKAKKRMLKFSNGFMSHFYVISEQISPLMAWGFFGPDENLKDVCHYFREQTLGFLSDIFNFQKCRFTTVEDLSQDIYEQMKLRVNNISVKFSQ